MTVMIFLGFIASCFVADAIVQYVRRTQAEKLEMSLMSDIPLDERNIYVPKGLMFDKGHTWMKLDDEGRVIVGADDFLQHVIGHITRIETVEPGATVKKGDPLCSIEQNGKTLKLYAPVSGKVSVTNRQLAFNAELLNSDPYHDGWIYKIEPVNLMQEMPSLLLGSEAKNWLKDEIVRLKDFIAFSAQRYENAPVMMMQDGGSIKERPLENSRLDIWNEFQTEFIDAVNH